MNRKISPLLLVFMLLLMAGLGYAVWQKTHPKSATVGEIDVKYISLGGGYLFSIPAKYSVDETGLRGVSLIYPENQSISGKNLEELYDNGTVAIQLIEQLKNDNIEAFKDYVNDTFAAELRSAMHSATDIREVKQGDLEAIKVFAQTNEGKRLRTVYALNLSRPVLMVTKEESEALKVVGGTMEDLKKTKYKADIDRAVQATKNIAEMLQKQNTSGIKRQATADFNKSASKDKLSADLKSAAAYLERTITIAGGSYNGKLFVGELIFEPKTKEQSAVRGVVSLKKQGNSWELDALQLSK